jgi:hypothetical protein
MSAPQAQQGRLLIELLQLFIDAAKTGGSVGAPGGVMYSAVCDKISLQQFQSIMNTLVRLKKVRKQGDLYFWLADL